MPLLDYQDLPLSGQMPTHRDLQSSTSAANSIVSGAGIVANKALTTHTVTVTARDTSGNNRGVGGDRFQIRISNVCTSSNFN